MKENYTDKMLATLYSATINKDKLTTDITGMTVSIRKASNFNAITFRCRKFFQGKRKDYVLGKYPEMKIIEARKKYLEYITTLATGIDPEQQDEKKTDIVSFGALWREYRALQNTKIVENTQKKYESAWRTYLKDLDCKPIGDINPQFMIEYLKPLIDKQEYGTAQKLASMVRAVVDYAVFKQHLPFNPLAQITRFLPQTNFKHLASFKDATLERDMTRLFEDIDPAPKKVKILLYMYFFSLLRSVELRRLKICDIDLDNGFFKVKTKTLSEFNVPVTTQMKKVIEYMICDHKGYKNPFLFEGEAEDGIISDGTVNKMLKTYGYGDRLKVHGIRSCGRQYMQTLPDVKESIIEQCLSHVGGSKVEQAYNRGEYLAERLRVMQIWCDFVEKCAGEKFTKLFD